MEQTAIRSEVLNGAHDRVTLSEYEIATFAQLARGESQSFLPEERRKADEAARAEFFVVMDGLDSGVSLQDLDLEARARLEGVAEQLLQEEESEESYLEAVEGVRGNEAGSEREVMGVPVSVAAELEVNLNPQEEFPEAGGGYVTEAEFDGWQNYWLSNMGFALDGARKHIATESDAATWLSLKARLVSAKTLRARKKCEVKKDLQAEVYPFVRRLGTSGQDYQQARAGNV